MAAGLRGRRNSVHRTFVQSSSVHGPACLSDLPPFCLSGVGSCRLAGAVVGATNETPFYGRGSGDKMKHKFFFRFFGLGGLVVALVLLSCPPIPVGCGFFTVLRSFSPARGTTAFLPNF